MMKIQKGNEEKCKMTYRKRYIAKKTGQKQWKISEKYCNLNHWLAYMKPYKVSEHYDE